ncbi:MAG: hypothetical protein J1E81_07530 [Eubacterium sp.]|nr:hypothetical protein [Eubacterium sp.]
MANTSLAALNDMLFQQLETITNPDLSNEELEAETKRTKAVTDIATKIVDNAKLELDALKFKNEVTGYSDDVSQHMFFLPEKIKKS